MAAAAACLAADNTGTVLGGMVGGGAGQTMFEVAGPECIAADARNLTGKASAAAAWIDVLANIVPDQLQ